MHLTHVDRTTIYRLDDHLATTIEQFLIARTVERLSKHSINFYRHELVRFSRFCDTQAINRISQIDSQSVRNFLLWLEERGHNPGGCHAAFRALRALLYWWEIEYEPDHWRNPIRGKVKAPKVTSNPLPGIPITDVQKMVASCQGRQAVRDKAILLFLIDTGVRQAECCALDIMDVDMARGSVVLQLGKGDKQRMVFIGRTTRQSLLRYLKTRTDLHLQSPLFVTDEGDRVSHSGLRQVVRRRAKDAGISEPGLHDFRRCFALEFLRNGGNVLELQRLLGHADLNTTRRYVLLLTEDLAAAHRRSSPVDRWRL